VTIRPFHHLSCAAGGEITTPTLTFGGYVFSLSLGERFNIVCSSLLDGEWRIAHLSLVYDRGEGVGVVATSGLIERDEGRTVFWMI